MSQEIACFLSEQYPGLTPLLQRVGVVARLRRTRIPIPEAVVRITIGQMMSGRAADTIYRRVTDKAKTRGVPGSWCLSTKDLRQCGLNGRKVRTVKEFASAYAANPKRFSRWRNLSADDLFEEVRSFWGMSDWSASMLGIFHFGHEDIFPETDGTIIRAIGLLEKQGLKHESDLLDSSKAAPYRSYLALYLWRAVDLGYLK